MVAIMKTTNMQPKKFIAPIMLITIVGAMLFSLGNFSPALALTVPTRTPVPPPPGGGSGGGGGGGGGSVENTPVPTNPLPTATPLSITIAPTPIDGFITPEPCGIPIFQASNGTVNVRSTPATTGALAGQLVYLESRGIIGQLATSEWWLIVLADGTQGWVADATGIVFGNTAAVPSIDANKELIANPSWQPTPNPICPTLTPTAIPTVTATPLPLETSTQVPTATAAVEEGSGTDISPTPTAEPSATAVPPTATVQPQPTPTTETLAQVNSPTDDAAPRPTGGGPNLFLLGGLALLLAGFGAYVIQRRNAAISE
jgi:hypothetical protein